MTHGDDTGLLFPPRVAPIQVVVVPIWKKEEQKADVMAAAEKTERILKAAGVRVKLDAAEQKTPGWKYNFWEMKGVPIRIEIGPRDVAENVVVVARRDVPGKDGKQFGVSMDEGSLVEFIQKRLEEVQESLLARATAFRDSNIVDVGSYEELKAAVQEGKWARGPWAASDEDEARVKEETGATIRCFPFEQPQHNSICFYSGNPASEVAIFAKSY